MMLTAVISILYAPLLAQSADAARIFGDARVKQAVEAETGQVYGKGQPFFLLTRGNPFALAGCRGTELVGYFVKDHFARIVASAWTDRGKLAIEYFLRGGTLLHVYESFEYFEDRAPKQVLRNFKGFPSWERHSYFQDGTVAYAEARGAQAPTPGADGARFLMRARKLVSLLEAKRRRMQPDTTAK
jgi:hypothetical protein